MLSIVAGIGGRWIAQSLRLVFSGRAFEYLADANCPTSVILALGLVLVVPFLILRAIKL